ncbi:MAG TPA: hypothetical protein EYG20_04185, partial [Alcanivorax sp.]|nr:hypothetical protein [Alcanivorax sp.]
MTGRSLSDGAQCPCFKYNAPQFLRSAAFLFRLVRFRAPSTVWQEKSMSDDAVVIVNGARTAMGGFQGSLSA